MSTKIQISNIKILEALLADPEVSIDLKRGTIKEYEKKCIIPAIEERLAKIVDGLVADLVLSNPTNSWQKPRVNEKYKQVFKEAVTSLIQTEVDAINKSIKSDVSNAVETLRNELGDIRGMIAVAINGEILQEIKKQVKAEIKASL